MKPETAPDSIKPEVLDDPDVVVEWNDRKWIVPTPDAWDVEASEAAENGKAITFLKMLLGRKQWAKFLAGDRRGTKDAGELMGLIMEAIGERDTGE